jgi:hypothetical protein
MFGLFRKDAAVKAQNIERRTHERFAADMLTCPVGKVVDLSIAGMSLTTDRKPTVKPGQVCGFPLSVGSRTFNLVGRVLRVRRKSIKQYEIGVAFVNPDQRVVHILTSVARFGFVPKDGAVEEARRNNPALDTAAMNPASSNRDPAGIYRLLGVSPDASESQINEAFRTMARQYHPDLNRAIDAQQQFIAIKQAYDVLRDADRRQRYDRSGVADLPSAAREHASRP